MKIAQPIINEITPESSALLIFRGALKLAKRDTQSSLRTTLIYSNLESTEPLLLKTT